MREGPMVGGTYPYVRGKKYTVEVPNNNPKEYRRHAYFDAIRKGKSKLRFDQKALKKKKQKKKSPTPHSSKSKTYHTTRLPLSKNMKRRTKQ